MQSLITAWTALEIRRRMIVITATIGVFAAVLLVAGSTGTKDNALLFGGLEAGAAGEVIAALDQRGVSYQVQGNAIYVPTNIRDGLRMSLATDGLPKNGGQGYELLDSLSGFGTTSQMFDAAYWRAKEGELARTILANPSIRSARVHISSVTGRPFLQNPKRTAAVTITTASNGLPPQHIKALQFLIGSAVVGLSPDAVAIIDGSGGLLSEANVGNPNVNDGERADILRQRAERLLAARVGPGNAVVEVSIDTVTDTESITERRVDPESRIAISAEVSESTGTSVDAGGGSVTVASNLPDGDGAAGGTTSNNENSESRSVTNYEVSQTERQLLRTPGAIKRLTVAVLVNDISTTGSDGQQTVVARSDDELQALNDLVAAAVGIDTGRGDVITLKSMAFEPIVFQGTEATAPALTRNPLDIMSLIQLAVFAVVAIILGLFVVRPILAPPPLLPAPVSIGTDPAVAQLAPPASATRPDGQAVTDDPDDNLKLINAQSSDPVARLRQAIADRENETIQILQNWMEDPDEKERT